MRKPLNIENKEILTLVRKKDLPSIVSSVEKMKAQGLKLDSKIILEAAVGGELNIFKYLFEFKELQLLQALHYAVVYDKWDIVEYLIFDFKLNKNAAVEEYLIEFQHNVRYERLNGYFLQRQERNHLDSSIAAAREGVSHSGIIKI